MGATLPVAAESAPPPKPPENLNSPQRSYATVARAPSGLTLLKSCVDDPSLQIQNRRIQPKKIEIYKGKRSIFIPDDEIRVLLQPFKLALVGKFSHGCPKLHGLAQGFRSLGLRGKYSIGHLDPKHVLITCTVEEDYSLLWLRRDWKIWGFPMRVLKWTKSFKIEEESPIVPVWITIPMPPAYLLSKDILIEIAKMIGKPLRIDESTACRTKPGIARICVELNLLEKLQDSVVVRMSDEEVLLKIAYEKLPKYCTVCRHLGHEQNMCLLNGNEHNEKLGPVTGVNRKEKGAGKVMEAGKEQAIAVEHQVFDKMPQREQNKGALESAQEPRVTTPKTATNPATNISPSVIVEALKVDSLQKLCSSLEPILRRVVSEEVERALAKLGPAAITGRVSPRRIEGPDGRNLQLHFRSKLSLPLFTGGKVEGEQGTAIHFVLLDANTGHVVTSGPESTVKLDLVVLEGDFNNEDDDGWSREEFESHIVKEREGKRPLLNGDLQVALKEGVGTLGELTFTDNSSWIRSRKFRLGLKVASNNSQGFRIREAKTDAFTVKDHRGELYKKHYPPALDDEVWRLEKIGKDGSFHKRLNKAGICNVEDFLRLVVRDQQKLRNILGSGMSNKMWEVLVEHSKTCVLSGKVYVYYPDEPKNVGVVFNHIYELSGLIAGGQYHPVDTLSDSQKVFVDTLVKKAYENWMHVIEYDGKSLLGFDQSKSPDASQYDNRIPAQEHSFDQLSLPSHPATVPSEHPSINPGLTIGYHDNMGGRYPMQPQSMNLNVPIQLDGTSFTAHNQMINASQQRQASGSENILALGQPLPTISNFHAGGTSNLTSFRGYEDIPEDEIRVRSHEMLENEDMQHLLRIFSMGGHGQTSSFNTNENNYGFSPFTPITPSNFGFDEDRTRSSGKAVIGWLKLKAALRWGIFIRKKAAERRAQIEELDDF